MTSRMTNKKDTTRVVQIKREPRDNAAEPRVGFAARIDSSTLHMSSSSSSSSFPFIYPVDIRNLNYSESTLTAGSRDQDSISDTKIVRYFPSLFRNLRTNTLIQHPSI